MKKSKKHPQNKTEIERDKLKEKYGKYNKRIRERKNYPFGRKSIPVVTFEKK